MFCAVGWSVNNSGQLFGTKGHSNSACVLLTEGLNFANIFGNPCHDVKFHGSIGLSSQRARNTWYWRDTWIR
jgi:hypothetical protein